MIMHECFVVAEPCLTEIYKISQVITIYFYVINYYNIFLRNKLLQYILCNKLLQYILCNKLLQYILCNKLLQYILCNKLLQYIFK